MDTFKVKGVKIDAVVSCVPDIEIDNEKSLQKLYGDEAKLIIESTGIKQRYIAENSTTTSELCLACAKEIIIATGISPNEICGVVFVTFTPDRKMPFNASTIQNKLKLRKEIPAFDINLACSGYAYGLYIASLLCSSCRGKVLLLDGDIQSKFISPYDKSTVPVLSDGASATLLSYNTNNSESEWTFAFYTDGKGRECLTIPAGGTENPCNDKSLVWNTFADGSRRRDIDIFMDGFSVFHFVAVDVSKWLSDFIFELGDEALNIDFFVPHQANMYMIKKLAGKLKFSWEEKTWRSGDLFGNSGSATVPITISYNAGSKLIKDRENKILISGFGAGLSASAGLITLNPDSYFKIFRYSEEKIIKHGTNEE